MVQGYRYSRDVHEGRCSTVLVGCSIITGVQGSRSSTCVQMCRSNTRYKGTGIA
jgi:hypothetical protein